MVFQGEWWQKTTFLYVAMLKGEMEGFSLGEKLLYLVFRSDERRIEVGEIGYARLEKNTRD